MKSSLFKQGVAAIVGIAFALGAVTISVAAPKK